MPAHKPARTLVRWRTALGGLTVPPMLAPCTWLRPRLMLAFVVVAGLVIAGCGGESREDRRAWINAVEDDLNLSLDGWEHERGGQRVTYVHCSGREGRWSCEAFKWSGPRTKAALKAAGAARESQVATDLFLHGSYDVREGADGSRTATLNPENSSRGWPAELELWEL